MKPLKLNRGLPQVQRLAEEVKTLKELLTPLLESEQKKLDKKLERLCRSNCKKI